MLSVRQYMAVTFGAVCVLGGCSSPRHPTPGGAVAPEFRAACGHPGSHVKVRHVPVTVHHKDCDLTGVLVTYRNYGGAYVSGKAGDLGTSSGLEVDVAPGTLDVWINAPKFGPGNA